MHLYPAAFFRLLLPALLIGSALWARPLIGRLDGELSVIIDNLPYLIVAATLIVANQFRRFRVFAGASLVALAYWFIQAQLQASLLQEHAAKDYLVISLAVPILGLALLLIPERGIWSRYGLVFTLLLLVLLLASGLLAAWLPQVGDAAGRYYAAHPSEGYILSLGATLLTAVTITAGSLFLLLRDDEADAAILGAVIALATLLALLHLDDISVAMCSVAGLSLLWGLVQSSHAMAYRDQLTGLLGRRALSERLQNLRGNYCIAMLDIDHFKRCNDTHGHEVGDQVLKLVASRIQNTGGGGIPYRYGGEEFCVVFPRRPVSECVDVLNRVKQEIAGYTMSVRDRNLRPRRSRKGTRHRGATRLGNEQVAVTISIGIAGPNDELLNPEAVIKAADANLYKAKKAGRNRVIH